MYCKIENDQIIQCSIHPETDFDWLETGVCGMVRNSNGTFSNPVPTQEQLMDRVRFQRNNILAQTDWRFRSDLTPSQAWIDYCQALRDLPANSTPALDENGQLTGVNWPTPPEN